MSTSPPPAGTPDPRTPATPAPSATASVATANASAGGFGEWLNALTDAEAHIALVTGTYLGRLAMALVVTLLSAPVLSAQAMLFTGVLLIGTLVLCVLALQGDLKFHRLPSQGQLTFAAVLDAIWITLGYVGSGYSGMVFPALLVLVLGIHGVLLGAARSMAISLLAGALFLIVSNGHAAETRAATDPSTQLALFLGVGMLAAVVGNRIRAAGWTVQRLTDAVESMTVSHHEVVDDLPVGVVVVAPGHQVEVVNRVAAAMLQCSPVTPTAPTDGRVLTLLAAADVGMGIVRAIDAALDRANASGQLGLAGELVLHGRLLTWVVVGRDQPEFADVRRAALAAPARIGESAPQASGAPITLRRTALIVLTDHTEKRRAEHAARASERFAAVAELSGGLAHEIRNPVAALRSAAEQLGDQRFLDPHDRQLVDLVLTESDRLSRLVSAFLEFARVGGGQIGQHVVDRVVRDAISTALAARKATDPEIRIEPSIVAMVAYTDADLVVRVMSNLIQNAVQFSKPGGRVDIKGSYESDTGMICLTVRDYGEGIPEDLQGKIFLPFFTTRPTGSGLGLAIAHRSATLLGGTLSCEAPPRTPFGATGGYFVFRFPSGAVTSAPVADPSLTASIPPMTPGSVSLGTSASSASPLASAPPGGGSGSTMTPRAG